MSFQDWYEVLEVSPDADTPALRRAWRRQLQRNHPDRHPNDPQASARFILVQRAFAILSDPGERPRFDAQRQAHLARASTPAPALSPAPAAFSFRQWWHDLRDTGRAVETLPQADRASVVLRVPLASVFDVAYHQVGLRVARTCPACAGQRPRCQICMGTGQRFVQARWQVKVAAGAPDGSVMRLAGQGHQGPRFGAPGDVLVEIVWTRRGIWRWRDGMLIGRLRVSLEQLQKGARLRVRAPDGQWGWFDLSPGPGHARLVRLASMGLPESSGQRGPAFIECYPARRPMAA